ncbi:MAG: hypothetical protein GY869_30185, partial [Planctomycetes bacterium]|nr:hypothetical protein [Planctomycetota bacterium]
GNRIDLGWENPQPNPYDGVCVIRRQSRYPASEDDGFLVMADYLFTIEIDKSHRDALDAENITADLIDEIQAKDNDISLTNATVIIEKTGHMWRIINGIEDYRIIRASEGNSETRGLLDIYGRGLNYAIDKLLPAETIYYYALFPFRFQSGSGSRNY